MRPKILFIENRVLFKLIYIFIFGAFIFDSTIIIKDAICLTVNGMQCFKKEVCKSAEIIPAPLERKGERAFYCANIKRQFYLVYQMDDLIDKRKSQYLKDEFDIYFSIKTNRVYFTSIPTLANEK